jgi:hypothetical protein
LFGGDLGAQNHQANTEATWTIRDAYTHALTTTCLEKDADLLPGEESTTPGTLSYRVVRRNFKLGIFSFGHYVGEIEVTINPAFKEMPVTVLRHQIGSDAPRATSAEREEHHRWQDDFCKTLLDRIVEIREVWAQKNPQVTPSEPTVNQTEEKHAGSILLNILGQKRIFGLRVGYLIAFIFLFAVSVLVSWFVFPGWSLLVLVASAVVGVTAFLANFRKISE